MAFYFMGFNIIFALIAFLPVAYRPVSGGSGIAEAKATLNGTRRKEKFFFGYKI